MGVGRTAWSNDNKDENREKYVVTKLPFNKRGLHAQEKKGKIVKPVIISSPINKNTFGLLGL